MTATHHIKAVSFERNLICLQVDGKSVKLPLDKVLHKLELANEIERTLFNISPSGYGIHWPLLDEDIPIDFLLKAL